MLREPPRLPIWLKSLSPVTKLSYKAHRVARSATSSRRDNKAQRGVVAFETDVIASTDCGLGGRIHPQIAWAKLAALADGAKLATRDLWQ